MKTGATGSRFSYVRVVLIILCYMILCSTARADTITHQITGLFAPEREQDLREAFKQIPEIRLVTVDFKNGEATLEYAPAKVFPKQTPEQVVQRIDGMLKAASNQTFGVKPLRTVPRAKLRLVEIPVAGLDCKACCLAAYEAVYRLEGVETATASFRDGLVTVLIDPDITNRSKLEAALKQRGVSVKPP